MQLTPHRSSAPDSGEITFPKLESWNPMTKVATIAADMNKKRILCRISLETLTQKLSASEEQPMESVVNHRATIQKAARKLIEDQAYEEDGSIFIRADDI